MPVIETRADVPVSIDASLCIQGCTLCVDICTLDSLAIHQLTCRQTERTSGLAADAMAKDEPDGLPSGPLQRICDDLLEASIPAEFKDASRSLAVDWTDMEARDRGIRPGRAPAGVCPGGLRRRPARDPVHRPRPARSRPAASAPP